MQDDLTNEWMSLTEWYSLHVHSGLPAKIARAASRRHITPSEFLEQCVERALAELGDERPERTVSGSREPPCFKSRPVTHSGEPLRRSFA